MRAALGTGKQTCSTDCPPKEITRLRGTDIMKPRLPFRNQLHELEPSDDNTHTDQVVKPDNIPLQ